ncbi:MAG: SDR family NAD(P)-dependent oxidoreductase [Desulfobacterales bacterium]|nr:SDR family NAD(P)-dependent oxidoreductase [Desulfobacterales bacterium]
MKILVTGGAGFIGSHTVDALLSAGHDVRILDNLQKPVHLKGKPPWLQPDAEFIRGDVRDKNDWQKALKKIDAVYHFAAYQDYLTDFSTFFHTNTVSTALLYEIIVEKKLDIQRVVVASSQFAQGEGLYQCSECGITTGPSMRPEEWLKRGVWEHRCPECESDLSWLWTAESYSSPPNAYALTKQSQELQAITFGKRYNIPSVALRYSIVQGPRQSFYNAYSGACRIFALHYYFAKPPTLYEDGKQCRDFVNIKDVVRANLKALEEDRMIGGVFNIGGGKPYTVHEFAEIVKKEIQAYHDKPLPSAKIPHLYRFGDTRHACSDISKISSLGWSPRHSPVDSVKGYLQWLYRQDNVEDILEYAMKTMQSLNVIRSAINQ